MENALYSGGPVTLEVKRCCCIFHHNVKQLVKPCLLLLLLLQQPQLLEVRSGQQLVVGGNGGAAEVLGRARVFVLRLPSYVTGNRKCDACDGQNYTT